MEIRKCIILGGGGHAAVLIDTLLLFPDIHVVGILDTNPNQLNQEILGVPVLGPDDILPKIRGEIDCFVVGIGTKGNNLPRKRLFEFGLASNLKPLIIFHPSSVYSKFAEIGAGCQLLSGSIINARSIIGSNTVINSGAIVEHDCIVGDHVYIGIGTCLTSGVKIGEGTYIGAGVIIKQGIIIGNFANIADGSIVKDNIPNGTNID